MAKILCVCISKERKTSSQNIHECEADLQGLVGDVINIKLLLELEYQEDV